MNNLKIIQWHETYSLTESVGFCIFSVDFFSCYSCICWCCCRLGFFFGAVFHRHIVSPVVKCQTVPPTIDFFWLFFDHEPHLFHLTGKIYITCDSSAIFCCTIAEQNQNYTEIFKWKFPCKFRSFSFWGICKRISQILEYFTFYIGIFKKKNLFQRFHTFWLKQASHFKE